MSVFATRRVGGGTGQWLPAVGVAGVFVLFLLMPLVWVFVQASGHGALGAGGAGAFRAAAIEVLSSPRTRSIITFTVGQASLSALIAVVVALPGAYLMAHYTFPGRRLIYSLSLLPFVLPTIIVVVAMIGFYGTNGVINRLFGTSVNLVYNVRGIILAHVFYNFSLAIRVISTAWAGIDRRYRESAEILGDSAPGIFTRVTLPLLLPSILTSFLLVFIYCFMSFGVVLVFGGVRYSTFEVAIYREMFINLDLPAAAVFALLQLVFSGAFIALTTGSLHWARAGALDTATALPSLRKAPTVARALLGGYVVLMVLFVLGPLATLVVRAFTGSSGTLGLENFRQLFVPGAADRNVESILRSSVAGVIVRSIALAAASGTLTFAAAALTALGLRGSRAGWVDGALQIPLGVSLVTVGLGLRLLWQGVLPPLVLIIVGQFFVAFPLVFRIVRTGVEELSERIVNAASILGASRWQILTHIELPLLRRTFLNAYAYALALPFADFTMAMTVGRGRIATFPVAIYRLIGFRSFDLALALAVVYIALCLGLFLVIDRTSLARGIQS